MITSGSESCGLQQQPSTFPCLPSSRSESDKLYRVHVGREIDSEGRVVAFAAEYDKVTIGDEDCYVVAGGTFLQRAPFAKNEWFACKRDAQIEAASRVKQLGMRLVLQAEIMLDEIMPKRPDHD